MYITHGQLDILVLLVLLNMIVRAPDFHFSINVAYITWIPPYDAYNKNSEFTILVRLLPILPISTIKGTLDCFCKVQKKSAFGCQTIRLFAGHYRLLLSIKYSSFVNIFMSIDNTRI